MFHHEYKRDIGFIIHIFFDTVKVLLVLGGFVIVKAFSEYFGIFNEPIAHTLIIISEYAALLIYILDLLLSTVEHFGILKYIYRERP